jgi:FMN phosphatase YigB (HAD superfamily)
MLYRAERKSMGSEQLASVKGVLFDLDGTLLQVEMREFIPAYIQGLAKHFPDAPDPATFDRAVKDSIRALLASDEGAVNNEQFFLTALGRQLGLDAALCGERVRRYCANGMAGLESLVRPLALARNILARCFERGLRVALATNPVFPRQLVEARLRWAEIADFPFDYVTTFDNSRYCKPHPAYFRDVLSQLGLTPEECIMVGNDTEHDLGARSAGITTFLVDTWLLDRAKGDYVTDFRGGHCDLFQFLGKLGAAN